MPKDPISQMRTLGLKVPATLLMRLSKAVLSHLRAILLLVHCKGHSPQPERDHTTLCRPTPRSSPQAVAMLS